MERMKAANALLSYYLKLYKEKYDKQPTINRYKEKYAMADVVDSVGYERGKALLDYYFRLMKPGHPLQFFLYNFDRMDEVVRELDKDKVARTKLLRDTAARVKEFEATHER